MINLEFQKFLRCLKHSTLALKNLATPWAKAFFRPCSSMEESLSELKILLDKNGILQTQVNILSIFHQSLKFACWKIKTDFFNAQHITEMVASPYGTFIWGTLDCCRAVQAVHQPRNTSLHFAPARSKQLNIIMCKLS